MYHGRSSKTLDTKETKDTKEIRGADRAEPKATNRASE
jgi:hypothetical protein